MTNEERKAKLAELERRVESEGAWCPNETLLEYADALQEHADALRRAQPQMPTREPPKKSAISPDRVVTFRDLERACFILRDVIKERMDEESEFVRQEIAQINQAMTEQHTFVRQQIKDATRNISMLPRNKRWKERRRLRMQ